MCTTPIAKDLDEFKTVAPVVFIVISVVIKQYDPTCSEVYSEPTRIFLASLYFFYHGFYAPPHEFLFLYKQKPRAKSIVPPPSSSAFSPDGGVFSWTHSPGRRPRSRRSRPLFHNLCLFKFSLENLSVGFLDVTPRLLRPQLFSPLLVYKDTRVRVPCLYFFPCVLGCAILPETPKNLFFSLGLERTPSLCRHLP